MPRLRAPDVPESLGASGLVCLRVQLLTDAAEHSNALISPTSQERQRPKGLALFAALIDR